MSSKPVLFFKCLRAELLFQTACVGDGTAVIVKAKLFNALAADPT